MACLHSRTLLQPRLHGGGAGRRCLRRLRCSLQLVLLSLRPRLQDPTSNSGVRSYRRMR